MSTLKGIMNILELEETTSKRSNQKTDNNIKKWYRDIIIFKK